MPAITNAFTAQKPVKAAQRAKTCSVSFDEFARNAQPMSAVVGDIETTMDPRDFSTGSFGWMSTNCKGSVKLANGQTVQCMVDIKVYVINSKLAYRTPEEAKALASGQAVVVNVEPVGDAVVQ